VDETLVKNMSRQNKVNKDAYTQAGRLTPDEMAREKQKQRKPDPEAVRGGVTNRAPAPKPKGAARGSNRARSAPEE
jgi:hypothetical protein